MQRSAHAQHAIIYCKRLFTVFTLNLHAILIHEKHRFYLPESYNHKIKSLKNLKSLLILSILIAHAPLRCIVKGFHVLTYFLKILDENAASVARVCT